MTNEKVFNPWVDIIKSSNKIFSEDLEYINKFNEKFKNTDFEVKIDLYPEPYIGSPQASIILLNLNPGFSVPDYNFYRNEYAFNAWMKNISHQPQQYLFYLIDPQLKKLECGYSWWTKKLKEPIDKWGIEKVATNFCCIEYFPNDLLKYKQMKIILESQKYNFYLVGKTIQKNAIIILMRSKKLWFEAVPSLMEYKNLYGTK